MSISLRRLNFTAIRVTRLLAWLPLLLLAGSFSQAQAAGITLVQHVGKDAGTTTTSTLAFASANTAGNFIAVAIRGGLSSSQVFTVTDSNGNTYKQAALIGYTSSQVTSAIYYAENIKAGANTITVSMTVSGPLRFDILEYSGVATANSLDAIATATGSSTTPNSGNLTTTASGDLLLATVGTADPVTYTAGTGYTIRDFVPVPPNTKHISEDQLQAAAGTTSAGVTISSSDSWGVALAAFKPAGGVAGVPATITSSAGTPQSTTVNTAFGIQLQATVKDSFNNPVNGATVTFAAPGSGASGTFAGGVTATTNASGVATAAVLTANTTAGTYTVTASVSGVSTPASFSMTNLAGAASTITATAGTPQSATVNTAFATQLQATVKDSFGNGVSGATVTFAAPGNGASGTFAGGVATASTNASGIATAAVFTANTTAGAYVVTASVAGVGTQASFSMTNLAGAANSIAATAGTPQSATVNTAFAVQLQATVKDSFGNLVGGVTVTFTAPGSGASGAFAGGVKTATTNASGVATAAVFTANTTAGTYTVTASAPGVGTAANFSLTNLVGAASSITATAGTPQSASINTTFATQLQATVKDSFGNGVSGVNVTFTAPGSGASGTFAGGVNTAVTNASGVALAAVFTANATAGGPYTVTASASGVSGAASFSLTNLGNPPANITATAGTPQSATINTAFAAQLQVTVTDSGNNPVNGVTVTFAAPGSGASGTFAGGVNTAVTNASGVAISAVFTANSTAGSYTVTASVSGVASPANFSMTNLTGAAASIAATAGTPQSATVGAAFTTQFQATVKDAGGNLVSGVTVTFTAPGSGASGTFAGGVNTATTNASGVATAAMFTANTTAGAYNVTASASGVGTQASFLLTNLAGSAASIAATAGTPQSATVNTAFAAQLQATVKDSFNNPVSGVTVTFAAPASGASGTFAGGVNTATTNASGVATAAIFTANATAGGPYTVTAAVSGVGTSANFSLTNTASVAANIALVQHTSKDAGTTTSSTLAFASANTAGNFIAVAIRGGLSNTQVFTVSDSNGNTYKQAKLWGSTGSAVTTAIYYAENIKSGANTITVTMSVSGPLRFAISEYSNVAASNSLDGTAAASSTNTSPNSGNLTTTANGDLLLGAISTADSVTFTAGTGFTARDVVPAAPNSKLLSEDQIQSAAGTVAASATLSASSSWGAVLAAFKPASGGGSPTPNISGVSPTAGPVGTSVTISGTNFGSTQGTSTVTFNNVTASPTNWSNTSIVVPVPSGATTGNVVVTVGGVASNGVTFTVSSAPIINSLSPTTGPVGTSVTISGANFGSTQGTSTVTFNNTTASPTTWGNTSIVVPVPSGATTGNVVVTVGGVASNGVTFTVAVVTIKLVQTTSIDAGTTTSASLAFTSSNTAGNWIAVCVRAGLSGAQVFTVTDSNGNNYQQAVVTGVNGTITFATYYAENVKGGSNTIRVSDTVSGPLRLAIFEYSGVATSNSLDAVPVTNVGTSTAMDSSATTTGANGDLLLASFVTNNAATYTAGTGYKIEDFVPAEPNTKLIVEDQIQGSAGSATATATIAAIDNWGGSLVAFRSASGVAPVISVGISPTSASVPSGYGTQSFTVSVANDYKSLGVTFALAGAGCSGSTCGTLSNVTSTSATYTAPANVPSPATVTLTATSVADPTKSASAIITVTQGVLTVAVSPRRAGVTLSASQTIQFTDTVYNDPQNLGVTWQVDGNNGGNATTGTISSTGFFTPGTQPGQHTVMAVSKANASVNASALVAVTDLAGVYTHHNDNARTGQNLQEYGLTPATVTASTFGQLFSCPVDGYVYAQPLWVANLTINGGVHNVVYVATENDSIFAFDADSPSCVQLWKKSFLSTGVTPPTPNDFQGNLDVGPLFGMASTPVIDPATNTLYAVVWTKEAGGLVHRLHALDIVTGAEKFGGPVAISATNFTSAHHMQRPALLLANNTVYLTFASVGDQCPYWGWVMGYNASTLTQTFVRTMTNPNSGCVLGAGGVGAGGIWQGGAGPAADASGNVYVSTGNGAYDGTSNWGDSAVKLSPTGSIVDWFTPFNQSVFFANDIDVSSAGVVILPSSVGSAAHPNLAIATGKVAILYLLDQANMGKFNSSSNNDVQEVVPQPPPNTTLADGGNYSDVAYWNGNIYSTGQNFPLSQFSIANGVIATPQTATSSNMFPPRGGVPDVSANGTSGAIVWIIDYNGWQTNAPAILDAYDATNVSKMLYSSPASGTGAAGLAVKFTVPTVANAKVYVGGQSTLTVYGLLP